ncbi:hypothetical protein CLOM_g15117 [Closterium sp. NIES-68]|nr:hypothetical protein CLOM_g15117 [Closterium sp. NIES-68]GJP63553.1 hypothetical protein CLOP_g20616 [Closterium sp. NIES-67]
MAESASASSAARGSEASKPAASSFSVVTVTPPHPSGLDSAASKAASVAASVAVEMETPLIDPSHSLGGTPPPGTRVLLMRTSSDLFIRLPPLHWAKATLGFADGSSSCVFSVRGAHDSNRQLPAAAHVAAVWVERGHNHPHRLHHPRLTLQNGEAVQYNVLLPGISC